MRRRISDYVLLLLAVAAGGFAVWELRQNWARPPAASWLWYLLILAGVVGGVALRRMEAWLPDGRLPARPVEPVEPWRRIAGLCCCASAAILTAWVVVWLWPNFHEWQGSQWPWLAALCLILGGGWLLRAVGEPAGRDRGESDPGVADPSGHGLQTYVASTLPIWAEVCAFVFIGVLAVFLRTYRLSEIPAGIYVDETNGALGSLYILEGRGDSPFATGWYESPNGFAYYMALLFKLFGANHGSLKAVSIIPAVLTVLAVYPLGRQLFGPPTAIAAMLFMAVSRWHLTMSRWGWAEVAPLPFQVMATFLLVRGLRERRALDFAAGGLLAGLMVYTYLSSRLALITLAVFGMYWLLADPSGPIRSCRRHWQGFVLYLLSALLAVAPIAVTYMTNPFSFFNRVSEISIFNQVRAEHSWAPLVENIERHLKFFHQSGDRSGKHNLPGEPETDPVTGVLFVIGLGYGLVRFGDRRRGLLWLWMVFAMVAGMLSVLHESPQAFRTLNAVPAIALLAGDVAVRLARGIIWLRPATPAEEVASVWRTVLASTVLVGTLCASAAWETTVYFGRQADSAGVQGSFNPPENWVAQQVIAALERNEVAYLSPRFYDFSPVRFLVYGVMKAKTGRNTLDDRPYRLARPEVDLPVPDTGADALFLLDSYYAGVKNFFREYYPSARFEMPMDPERHPLGLSVKLTHDELAALQGLNAQFTRRRDADKQLVVPGIDENWNGRDVTAAQWHGGVRVERSGVYDFNTQGDLTVVVDAEPWTRPRFLGRGLHKLEVSQQHSDRQVLARLRWKTPPGSDEIVPTSALFRVGPPQHGLTAHYFGNETWAGEPLFGQTTPFLLLFWPEGEPVASSFSARFTGALRIEKPGPYHLRIDADDGAKLWLDGKVLAEGLTPLRVNRLLADVELSAGDHPIRIDYFQRGGSNTLVFFWQRSPTEPETPVPPDALIPEDPHTPSPPSQG